jgi:LysR family hydrogen peroxide-inducible transcriptional activator
LIAAEIDLALVSRPIDHPAIKREVLFKEKLLIVVGRDSPFANRKSVSMRDLDGQEAVVLDEMHCLAQQFQDVCRIMRVEHHVACTATQLATVQKLVELNLGVGLVPEMAATADESSRRVYLEVDGTPRREIAVATRAGRSRSVLAQRFLECLCPVALTE